MATSDKDIIICQGVKKWFGDFQALYGVDLRVKEGEVVVIIGPSGVIAVLGQKIH